LGRIEPLEKLERPDLLPHIKLRLVDLDTLDAEVFEFSLEKGPSVPVPDLESG
jgi:hypothetical protein